MMIACGRAGPRTCAVPGSGTSRSGGRVAAFLVFAFVLGAAWAPGPAVPAHGAPKAAPWTVHAIQYATLPDFPVHYLVAGADTTRTVDASMMVWLLQGPDSRRVLVDAGFYRQKFLDAWKVEGFVSPADAVERFGVSRDSITDIIVSHIHWDHVDGADLFPNARIWIQQEEYDFYVGPGGEPREEQIDSVDALMLARLREAGRIRFVDGDAREILPGITVYTGGKHTFASQYAGVRTAKGTVVIASDNLYLDENLEKRVPIAATYDAASNLAAQDRMRRIAGSTRRIVAGHDPSVFRRFRTTAPGVAKIE